MGAPINKWKNNPHNVKTTNTCNFIRADFVFCAFYRIIPFYRITTSNVKINLYIISLSFSCSIIIIIWQDNENHDYLW